MKNSEKPLEKQDILTRLENDLTIARKVQRAMMPVLPSNAQNMDLAAAYLPADMIGGDFYDFIITPKRKLAVLIFDISGHGVAAALVGSMCKMLFSNYIQQNLSPAAVFERVNIDVSEMLDTGHYLTAFLGIIDPTDNTMVYSRGGHVAPLLFRHSTGEVIQLEGCSVFIGHPAIGNSAAYFEDTIQLKWHDRLVLYTDGITESTDPTETMYGVERLTEVTAASGHLSPELFIKKILADNEVFRKGVPLDDDMTLLCIRIGCPQAILDQSGFSIEDAPGVLALSKHSEIEPSISVILRELDKIGLPEKLFFSAHLCMHEMLDNAIRHGNKLDPKKKVFLLYRVLLEKIEVSVVDQGDGFDTSNLPDPRLEENRIKDGGRGLFLISRYMDTIEFNAKGNRLKVTKFL